jgi:trehalose 6-phosphate phosphatase
MGDAALFLYIDGTLAEFAATPLEVGPDRDRTALLHRLKDALHGRIAAVSGRSISDIDRILERALPNVAGVHGLQRRSGKGLLLQISDPHPALPEAVEAFSEIARLHAGALVEMKPLSIALHYRRAPLAGPVVREAASELASRTGLSLQEGEMVVELLTPGRDKGHAVNAFMQEALFAGSVPIFVGDDITDETAFDAAQKLGGVGVIVGARKNTVATARLAGVAQVMAWLNKSMAEGAFQLEIAT